MGMVSAKLRKWADPSSGRAGFVYWCPGCKIGHTISTEGPGPRWDFDGNLEAPTFHPSIRLFTPAMPAEPGYDATPEETNCHCYVKAGRIEFLSDCEHELAGKTVELPDLPAYLRD